MVGAMKPRKSRKTTRPSGTHITNWRRRELDEEIKQLVVPANTTHVWEWIHLINERRRAICINCGLILSVISTQEVGGPKGGWVHRAVFGGNENGLGGATKEPLCPRRTR